jgi:hypothetical protein
LNSDLLPTGLTANSFLNAGGLAATIVTLTGSNIQALGSSQTPSVGMYNNWQFPTQGSPNIVYQLTDGFKGQLVRIQSKDSNSVVASSKGNSGTFAGGNIALSGGISTTNSASSSNSGQKTLNVTSVNGMQVGMSLILDYGTGNQEIVVIGALAVGAVTCVSNLSFTHTAGATVIGAWQALGGTTHGNELSLIFDGSNWIEVARSY